MKYIYNILYIMPFSMVGQKINMKSYIWPVNLICGQTKGQNPISIAEMDSLGSITYV